MNKFMSWLEDSFVPKANKLFSRPFIAAFSSTMQKNHSVYFNGISHLFL